TPQGSASHVHLAVGLAPVISRGGSERSAPRLTLPRVQSILSFGEDAEGSVAGHVGPDGRVLRERGRGGRSGDPRALVAPPHVRESPAFRYVLRRAPADRLVRRSRADAARATAG